MENGVFTLTNDSLSSYDLICFSHLRWDFVYQRPQHLMSRFAKDRRVFFVEEPVFHDAESELQIDRRTENLFIVKPHLINGTAESEVESVLRSELDRLVIRQNIENFASWYYTPMMLAWSEHLEPLAVAYDCMDELSAFKNAPRELITREAELFALADLVFTGGQSLYESKREQHPSVFCFPSSIDAKHFARALDVTEEPADQAAIARPRAGFFGVIDERTDIDLLGRIADLRPEIQFVMIGPVVKIDEADLPRRDNIHYLGGKKYDELPNYLAGWDVAIMPFALNESTRFISPTKTPEYLAAGRPVVSTPIRDVVRPYGEEGLVRIAKNTGEFVAAIDSAMIEDASERMAKVEDFLKGTSWDYTYSSMSQLIDDAVASHESEAAAVAV
jgi:UDP-galactopyranose mutase